MPERIALRKVLSLTLLCAQALSARRARELDLKFMTNFVSSEQCPEWNGYNTSHERSSGVMPRKCSVLFYKTTPKFQVWMNCWNDWMISRPRAERQNCGWKSHQAHFHHDCLCAPQPTAGQSTGGGGDVWPGSDLCKSHWAHVQFPWHLKTELMAYPPATFDSVGHMCITEKSAMRNSLQVAISSRSASYVDVAICYMSTLLWTIRWPPGTLQVYINAFQVLVIEALAFQVLVIEALSVCNAVFVLYRYFPVSAKVHRISSRYQTWNVSTPKSSILSVSKNTI